jgi:hypothetical protein
MISVGAIVKHNYEGGHGGVPEAALLLVVLEGGFVAASVVTGGLAALVLSGAYRRSTAWTDRLGRVTAAAWLAMEALLVLGLILWVFEM